VVDDEDKYDNKALRDFTAVPETLLLYTAEGHSVSLRNFYRGKSCFLVCSGPSLLECDLGLLREKPGIVTFGVNNSWAAYRPNLWTCVDRPGSFIDVGWKDPSILKFVPLGKLNERLHTKKGDGSFRKSKFKVRDMPAVLYFRRNEKFDAEQFLTQGTVNWGCHGKYTDHLGCKGSRSVMLAAVRLIHYLGFENLYLLGCDFKMEWQRDGQGNYAFKQWRWQSAVKGNNGSYVALNKRFEALVPKFKEMGFKVFNCCEGSGLTAFPFVSFEDAVAKASAECSKVVDSEDWYNHLVPGEKGNDDATKERNKLEKGQL